MKKILMAVALIVCLVFPLSSMAMTAIDDSDLSAVTGQAGVSINLDANVNVHIDAIAWGDKDGLGTTEASGAGWIGVAPLDATVRIKLRDDLINGALAGYAAGALPWAQAYGTATAAASATVTANIVAYMTAFNTAYTTALPISTTGLGAALSGGFGDPSLIAGYGTIAPAFGTLVANTTGTNAAGYAAYTQYETNSAEIQPLTIDVATDSGTGHGLAGTTFVRIGLGSIGIYVSDLDLTPALGNSGSTLTQELGELYIGGLEILINKASYVDIYNGRGAGTQGVNLGMNIVIDSIAMDTLSWGDTDGFEIPEGGVIANNAGYVGLQDLTIDGLTIVGIVSIDVATSAVGDKEAGVATTFVHIGFDNLAVGIGAVDGTVLLGRDKDFSVEFDTLGSIYMSGLDIIFDTGYVDIYNYNGKSGVVLDFGLTISQIYVAAISWGDSDGVSAGFEPTTGIENAGFVGMKGLDIQNLGLSGIVTIDVATVLATDAAPTIHAVGTTFVRIGFDGLNVTLDSLDATIALGTAKDTLSQELGSVYVSALDITVDGNFDISSHQGSQGVVFNMDLTVGINTIAAITWGDSDGLGAGTTAGFVGLKDLTLGTITVAGQVAIDVAHVLDAPGSYALVVGPQSLMYAGYYSHLMSPVSTTFVHIALGSGDGADDPTLDPAALAISISNLGFDIALDSAKTLANAGLAGSGLLGSVYMGGVDVRVNGWVDIAAH